ncbi:hypothetical protein [Gordonia sp. NPDC058843]|uniref:hypothetical protein n=1 Tax=Gordonia sp. NPDC058843 TaxID=3346648 RepID=UPI0036C5805D
MPDLDATWLNVAVELLKYCSENTAGSDTWANLDPGEPFDTIASIHAGALAAMFAADPTLRVLATQDSGDVRPLSFMSRASRKALCEFGRHAVGQKSSNTPRMHALAVARGMAECLDEFAGDTYLHWFRARGEVVLSPGEPYPVCRHDPRRWLGPHAANTKPASLPDRDLAQTRRLRIAGAAPYTYVIDFDSWNRLSPVGASGRLTVGVGQPNSDLTEFDIAFEDLPRRTFANFGPKDVAAQADRIARLSSRAAGRGADILVMPEYTLTEAVHTALLAREPREPREPRPTVVCTGLGSGPDDEGFMTNEGRLVVHTPDFARDHSVSTPRKLHPAYIGDAIEQVRSGTEVRVFASERWTLCVLICRDGMDDAVLSQLAAIGVNLLLVPAMSPKTASLTDTAASLCRRSQAFVVIANGPAHWADDQSPVDASQATAVSRAEAVFAGPYAEQPDRYWAVSENNSTPGREPGLWTFSFDERLVRRTEDND